MLRLREVIEQRAITGIFMWNPQRGPAKEIHRLLFRSMCKEHGVRVYACQWQLPDDDETGNFIEFADAWAKMQQVRNARREAKRGLRDRVVLRGLPTTAKDLFGYRWNQDRTALEPTTHWSAVKLIFDSALKGMSVRRISITLHDRGIGTAKGREWWSPSVLYQILSNPVYAGRYHALRWEAAEPKSRRIPGYGKSSQRMRDPKEWHWLESVHVVDPPITWDQFASLLEKFRQNKLTAKRNAKRDYLLRGRIRCAVHQTSYRGHYNAKSGIEYQCNTLHRLGRGPCPRPSINGSALENSVRELLWEVGASPDLLEREINSQHGKVETTIEALEKELRQLAREKVRAKNKEVDVLREKIKGQFSTEAVDALLRQLRIRMEKIEEDTTRIGSDLAKARATKGATITLSQLHYRLATLLKGGNEGFREAMDALGLRVRVSESGEIQVGLSVPIDGKLRPMHPMLTSKPIAFASPRGTGKGMPLPHDGYGAIANGPSPVPSSDAHQREATRLVDPFGPSTAV